MRQRQKVDNNIYQILTQKNMTQAELARKVGVKREYINRIINRRIIPTIPLVLKIAEGLNTKVEKIYFLVKNK